MYVCIDKYMNIYVKVDPQLFVMSLFVWWSVMKWYQIFIYTSMVINVYLSEHPYA